jgi:hypothetical protein
MGFGLAGTSKVDRPLRRAMQAVIEQETDRSTYHGSRFTVPAPAILLILSS